MSLPRMTTRRWMIVVALVGTTLGLAIRSYQFRRISKGHGGRATAIASMIEYAGTGGRPKLSEKQVSRYAQTAQWEAELRDKYRRAAFFPFLPVPPDPPEPTPSE